MKEEITWDIKVCCSGEREEGDKQLLSSCTRRCTPPLEFALAPPILGPLESQLSMSVLARNRSLMAAPPATESVMVKANPSCPNSRLRTRLSVARFVFVDDLLVLTLISFDSMTMINGEREGPRESNRASG